MRELAIKSWNDVETLLKHRPPETYLKLPRGWLSHPRTFGMKLGVGLPAGQSVEYFKPLEDGSKLRASAYESYYLVNLQRSEHLHTCVSELGRSVIAQSIAIGAFVGASLGQKQAPMMVGALLGGFFSPFVRRVFSSRK